MITLNNIKSITRLLTISLFSMIIVIPAYSGEVTYTDDSYTSGDPLTAADLNAKFNEIKADVNDNNTSIIDIDSLITDLLNRVATLESLVKNKINIDFGTFGGTPLTTYGAVASQEGLWNLVGLGASAITDLNGVTGVTINLNADSDGGSVGTCTAPDNQLLLCDNFYSSDGATWDLTINGLRNGIYTLYIYAPSNSAVPTGDMTVNGIAVASIPGDSSYILTEGTSYVVVTLVSVTGGSLTMSGFGATFSGLAGLQISP